MSTLSSVCLNTICRDMSDEDKMKLFTDLIDDINCDTFLISDIVFKKIKERLCIMMEEIYKEKRENENYDLRDLNCLKYLVHKSPMSYYNFIIAFAFGADYTRDMLRYVRPTKWNCKKNDEGLIIISRTEPFNFKEEVIDNNLSFDQIIFKTFRNSPSLWCDF
jgi:hypothetical protein